MQGQDPFRLYSGVLYASASCSVELDGNSVFANNLAMIDGGAERAMSIRGSYRYGRGAPNTLKFFTSGSIFHTIQLILRTTPRLAR